MCATIARSDEALVFIITGQEVEHLGPVAEAHAAALHQARSDGPARAIGLYQRVVHGFTAGDLDPIRGHVRFSLRVRVAAYAPRAIRH